MAKELVPDELWETIEALLPPEPPKPKGGRPLVDNRAALTGIIFVLKSGNALGDVAPRDGLWFWNDVLAAIA